MMIMIRYHHMDRKTSSIFLGIWAAGLLLLPLLRPTLDFPILLLTLVLGIFFVYSLIKLFDVHMVSLVALGVIVLQAQWGLIQFAIQRDLGMYIIGESRINVEREAVAKFRAFDAKFIRAYGPYAHANAFGGAVVVGAVMLSALLIDRRRRIDHERMFWLPVVGALLLGGLVSFSRSTYIGLCIAVGSAWYFGVRLKWVPLIGFTCVLVFAPLIYERLADIEDRGISDRISQWQPWRSIVKQHSWWSGSGVGRYSVELESWWQKTGQAYEPWEVASVHSVPLLMIAEWGWALGLLGIAVLVWGALSGGAMAAALVPALLFDHYFITQVGPLMWLLTLSGLWLARRRGR